MSNAINVFLYRAYLLAFECGMQGKALPVAITSNLPEQWARAFGYSDGQRTRGKTTEGRDGDWMPEDFKAFCGYLSDAMDGIPEDSPSLGAT